MTNSSPGTLHLTATVPSIQAVVAAAHPALPALVGEAGPVLSHARLAAQTAAIRSDLRRLGVGRTDRVVAPLGPGATSAALAFGLFASSVAVPLPPDLPADEAAALLARLRPAALVLPTGVGGALPTVAARLGVPTLRFGPPSASALGAITGAPVGPAAPDDPPGLDDWAMILCTSGTTGRAKLVPRTHRAFARTLAWFGPHLALEPGIVSLLLAPLGHSLGIGSLLLVVGSGGALVCPDDVAPARLPDLLARHDPVWFAATPAHLADLSRRVGGRGRPNPSLRFVRSSAAPLTEDLRARVEAALGVPILNGFGSSEATNMANETLLRPHRTGTVGALTAEIRIVGDDGAPLAEGEAGEVQTRGDHVFPGYWDDPDLTAAAFTPDGWFRTGDRGLVRDGYLTLLGRADDVINRGGQKIDPVEVEQVLAAHPAVAEAAVFGMPDPRLGEEVAAAVVLRPGARPTDRVLRRWALERLAPHKVPRTVHVVDALPRNANGKVLRRDLAAAAGSSGASG